MYYGNGEQFLDSYRGLLRAVELQSQAIEFLKGVALKDREEMARLRERIDAVVEGSELLRRLCHVADMADPSTLPPLDFVPLESKQEATLVHLQKLANEEPAPEKVAKRPTVLLAPIYVESSDESDSSGKDDDDDDGDDENYRTRTLEKKSRKRGSTTTLCAERPPKRKLPFVPHRRFL